jgi:NACalpha-BTF3-like transcription factor
MKRVLFSSSGVCDLFLETLGFMRPPTLVRGVVNAWHYYSSSLSGLRMATTTNLHTGEHASAGIPGYPDHSFDVDDIDHEPCTHYMSFAGAREDIGLVETTAVRFGIKDEVHFPRVAGEKNHYLTTPPDKRTRSTQIRDMDITLVLANIESPTNFSREDIARFIDENDGDIVETIMALTQQ